MKSPRRTILTGLFSAGLLCAPVGPGAAAQGDPGADQAHPTPPPSATPLTDKQAEGQPAPDEIIELPAEPAPVVQPAGQRQQPGHGPDLTARLEALEQSNAELTARLKDLDKRLEIANTAASAVRLTGYIDAGFFAFFRGNGSGITNYLGQPSVPGSITDPGQRYQTFLTSPQVQRFPEFFIPCGAFPSATAPVTCPQAPGVGYTQTQPRWRFLGDPLATAINSAGQPADNRSQNLPGQSSQAVVSDFIQSAGHPTFIINEINLTPIAKLGEHFQGVASINFYPRSASVTVGDKQDGGAQVPSGPTSVGDYLFADLAYMEYSNSFSGGRHNLSVFVGRFDSNIGIEYRVRKSPDRFGVTPSLICRYTCGTPLGIKVRARLFDDWVTLALAVQNGSSFQEQNFRFGEDTDKKYMKTLSGRAALHLPVLGGVELGVSGEWGGEVDGFYDAAGTNEFNPFAAQWTFDVDLHLEYRGFEFRGEFLKASADGSITRGLPYLSVQGGYLEASYRALNWLGFLLRGDVRDASQVDYTVPYAYIAEIWRLTVGARFDINHYVAAKAEYVHVQPFGRMADGLADNEAVQAGSGNYQADYLTTSLVLRY